MVGYVLVSFVTIATTGAIFSLQFTKNRLAAGLQLLDVLELNCTKLDIVCSTKKTVCMMIKPRCREKIVADKFPPFHI